MAIPISELYRNVKLYVRKLEFIQKQRDLASCFTSKSPTDVRIDVRKQSAFAAVSPAFKANLEQAVQNAVNRRLGIISMSWKIQNPKDASLETTGVFRRLESPGNGPGERNADILFCPPYRHVDQERDGVIPAIWL
ncbi:hypothetical protein P280DRAFT_535956 [Massarina eburnea CBS 473.64]|uniref:Uncharacterized protein n=1 Tax=Massarina eburnea CBS 473.64 TaxID=1395130 RepID=A0A6A6SFY9_9PLEO|nr:hypothetical protein P280DRAFT_535956 [Massarina eburnea CBS 473.64]